MITEKYWDIKVDRKVIGHKGQHKALILRSTENDLSVKGDIHVSVQIFSMLTL